MHRLATVLSIALFATLAMLMARAARPAFAGHNGKIAFTKAGEIWTMNADGSNPTQLTNTGGGNRSPRWSPDGTRIAFASGRDGDLEIFVMNADGSDQRQLTFNTDPGDKFPSWTADGKQIVYDKHFDFIYAINADGSGGERKIADGAVPATAPRGDRIAFTPPNTGLVTMRIDGTSRHQLTTFDQDFNASWAPSGNDLVFGRGVSEVDNDLYVVGDNGASLTRLTNTPERVEFGPVWSPDGTTIAFVGCVNFFTSPDCEIYMMNGHGQHETQVTSFGVDVGVAGIDWQRLG